MLTSRAHRDIDIWSKEDSVERADVQGHTIGERLPSQVARWGALLGNSEPPSSLAARDNKGRGTGWLSLPGVGVGSEATGKGLHSSFQKEGMRQ